MQGLDEKVMRRGQKSRESIIPAGYEWSCSRIQSAISGRYL